LFVFVETPFREFRSTRRFGSLFSSSPRRCVGARRSSSIYFRAMATRVVSLCDIDCFASSRPLQRFELAAVGERKRGGARFEAKATRAPEYLR
jgi:hypothetical protein